MPGMMQRIRSKFVWTMIVCVLLVGQVMACPFCSTDTGKQVRAEIFGEDFALNVARTLLPFPFLMAVVGLIYVGLPRRKDK
jgi:hypothetical protein